MIKTVKHQDGSVSPRINGKFVKRHGLFPTEFGRVETQRYQPKTCTTCGATFSPVFVEREVCAKCMETPAAPAPAETPMSRMRARIFKTEQPEPSAKEIAQQLALAPKTLDLLDEQVNAGYSVADSIELVIDELELDADLADELRYELHEWADRQELGMWR